MADTDAKGSERQVSALREENRILKQIIRQAPIPMFVLDRDHRITHFNRALEDLTGLDSCDLVGTCDQWRAFYARQRPVMADLIVDNSPDQNIVEHYGKKYDRTAKAVGRYAATDFFPDLPPEGKWLYFTASTFTDDTGNIAGAVETLQDVTAEKRLAANTDTILRISRALPEHPDLEDLMDFISTEVKRLLECQGAVVLLYDEIKSELFFIGASYDDRTTAKRAKEIRFPLSEVLAGEVIRTGKAMVDNNPDALSRRYPLRDKKMGYKTRSILCVPIKSDTRIIGVLCGVNKKRGLFDERDMALVTMIAGTAALSIENARFSDALKNAYRDVAAVNRARGRAINHLAHELKTPVAVLSGSFTILKERLESHPGPCPASLLDRIQRNLSRIVEIQGETADIMADQTYGASQVLGRMLETCQDELSTLVQSCLGDAAPDHLIDSVQDLITRTFSPDTMDSRELSFKEEFFSIFKEITQKSSFRAVTIRTRIDDHLPSLFLPPDVFSKVVVGLIKNAVENTPDHGLIEIQARQEEDGVLFEVTDFGVGIEERYMARIFDGFFATQKTENYATQTPYTFNAGGKGADLLRLKTFSHRLGFSLDLFSDRCSFLGRDLPPCPGDITACEHCYSRKDCQTSGGTRVLVRFPLHTCSLDNASGSSTLFNDPLPMV